MSLFDFDPNQIGFQQATMSKPVSRAGSELRAIKRRQPAAVGEVVGGEEKKGTAGEKPLDVVVVAAVVPAVEVVVVEVVSAELGLVAVSPVVVVVV